MSWNLSKRRDDVLVERGGIKVNGRRRGGSPMMQEKIEARQGRRCVKSSKVDRSVGSVVLRL